MQAAAAMQTVAGGGKKTWVDILCDNLCELGSLELKILLKCRVVSREWRGALDRALPLLRLVSFPIGVTGEGAKRTLGLVAGGNLRVVGLALCRKLSARDVEEILKLLDATCPGVREVDITGCSDEVILRALAVRALSTLGASPLHMHARLLELAAGTARCPFAAFLNALQAPRLLFDPAFAPAEGAFLRVAAEACNDGDGTAVVEAAMLLGVSFPVGNQGETRVFDCNQRDRNGRTALHRAAEQGCLALLFALLISAGANLNATDNQDDTPLLLACKKGMLEMATMLKDAGAAINVANKGGDTPLLAAVAAGNLELVKLLVRAGANLAARNKKGKGVFDHTKEIKDEEKRAAVLALMAEYSVLCAVATGKADLVAAAVAKGCTVNETDQEGNSCLHIAAAQGSNEILRILLNAGAKVSAKNKWCKTALDVATNDEVKAALRQHGARHSLFYAVEQGMLELVADLIKEGADMNEGDKVSLYRVLSVAFSV